MNEKLIKGLLRLSQKASSYNIAAYFNDEISMNIESVFDRLNEVKGIGPKNYSFNA